MTSSPSTRATCRRCGCGHPPSARRRSDRGSRAMIAESREPFMLVLDDVHELVVREVLDILPALVGEMPAGSAMVLGSRTAVQLPLGRLRARRRLVEVDPDELAFDALDTAMLLDRLDLDGPGGGGRGPARRAHRGLARRHLPRRPRPPQRSAHDEEHGPRASAVAHRFIVGTRQLSSSARLDRRGRRGSSPEASMHGTDLRAAVRRHGAAAGDARVLEGVRRRHRSPRESRSTTAASGTGVHHLLAEFLRSELDRHDAGFRRVTLHRRASDWYQERGDADEPAITHAVLGGDLPRAEALVLQWFGRMVASGRVVQPVERWMALFSEDELGPVPRRGDRGSAPRGSAAASRAQPSTGSRTGGSRATGAPAIGHGRDRWRRRCSPSPGPPSSRWAPVEMAAESRYGYEQGRRRRGISALVPHTGRGGLHARRRGRSGAAVRARQSSRHCIGRPSKAVPSPTLR